MNSEMSEEQTQIEVLQAHAKTVDKQLETQAKGIARLNKIIYSEAEADELHDRIHTLSKLTQSVILKGAIFTELEVYLRGVPHDKRSEAFHVLAWCWDNMPAEDWQKLNNTGLDAALHLLLTFFREKRTNGAG